jgi:hypothetical protein
MRTIHTDINIFIFTRNTRDVDRDGRRNTRHVSFDINVVCIKFKCDKIDYLTQGRSKIILFDPNNLWEEVRVVIHIIP